MVLQPPFQAQKLARFKQCRRTATSVLAGAFDYRPERDVLTSLLNGVRANKAMESEKSLRKIRRKEKKERERERRRAKTAAREKQLALNGPSTPIATISSVSQPEASGSGSSPYWTSRPAINIATMQRSMSVTPPPDMTSYLAPSSPGSTPGPSISSSTSRTSSKRPYTPYDGEELDVKPLTAPPMRKRRVPVKKGWKGWVEGSPPPSEKLINLDTAPILHDRRTRSGKNFDAISVGKESWI